MHAGVVQATCAKSGITAWIKNDKETLDSFNRHDGRRMPSAEAAVAKGDAKIAADNDAAAAAAAARIGGAELKNGGGFMSRMNLFK